MSLQNSEYISVQLILKYLIWTEISHIIKTKLIMNLRSVPNIKSKSTNLRKCNFALNILCQLQTKVFKINNH